MNQAGRMEPQELRESPMPYRVDAGLSWDAPDPILEVFRRDIDFTLVERNLRLTTEQRAEQLVNATRFIRRFRPLVH